jgi:hypothetical protein
MKWGEAPTTFHDHLEGEACNERCLEVPYMGMDHWTTPIRTKRMEHNHIFQMETVNGAWDCPACQSINPLHMRPEHVIQENYKMTRGS